MATSTAARPVDLSRPCWHCQSYAGLDGSGCYAVCLHGGRRHIQAAPTTGCVFWLRAPGADDVDGPPAGFRGTLPGVAPGGR